MRARIYIQIVLSIAVLVLVAFVVWGHFMQRPFDVRPTDVNPLSTVCGTLDMPGLRLDECTETFEIQSTAIFEILDGDGNLTVLRGPLLIKAVEDKN